VKLGIEHYAASTYGQLGILAGLQESFEDCGRWLVRSVASFLQTRDQREAERNTANFIVAYQFASPAVQQKLEAIWREADLGPFPTEPKP